MKDYKKYIILIFAELISAIQFNLLLKPINLVTGGTSGLSIIINHVFSIDTNVFIATMYVITFTISIIFLGKNSIWGLLIASITYPLFTTLTANITNVIVLSYEDIFLITIFAAIIGGISNGLIFRYGFPSSGISVLCPIIHKYFKVPISIVNFIMNTIIVLLGGYYFSLEYVLFAIIYLYLCNYITNIIIIGKSSHKALLIRSDNLELINNILYFRHSINPTILNTSDGNKVSLAVVSSRNYNLIKEEILSIDKKAFFVTSNSYEFKHKIRSF